MDGRRRRLRPIIIVTLSGGGGGGGNGLVTETRNDAHVISAAASAAVRDRPYRRLRREFYLYERFQSRHVHRRRRHRRWAADVPDVHLALAPRKYRLALTIYLHFYRVRAYPGRVSIGRVGGAGGVGCEIRRFERGSYEVVGLATTLGRSIRPDGFTTSALHSVIFVKRDRYQPKINLKTRRVFRQYFTTIIYFFFYY